jgi:hypothetical protein
MEPDAFRFGGHAAFTAWPFSCILVPDLILEKQIVIRWIALILLSGGLTAQIWGQTPAGQSSAAQKPATQAAPPEQPAKPSVPDSTPPKPSLPQANPADPLEQFTDFSALMVGTVLPRDEREGHVYRSGNMLRMEGMENRGYFITDLTTFETYGQSSMGCASMKEPYLRSFPFVLSGHSHKVERLSAGKEIVDGHNCQIEEVTYSGGLPQPWKLKFWEAEDLRGFPIRIEARAGSNPTAGIIQYKNVILGPQDSTLFIYPKDCAELPEPAAKEPAAKEPVASPQSPTPPPSQH